jgi:hypothetical protein
MPYAPKPKKKAAPKGGGKAATGTNLYTPVKQSTIDNIKKMGMAAALKKAGSSQNAEFVQGVKRMYGADRLKKAMKSAAVTTPKTSRTTSATAPKAAQPRTSRTKSATAPASKPAATTKYTSKNPKPLNPKGLFPGLLGGKKK